MTGVIYRLTWHEWINNKLQSDQPYLCWCVPVVDLVCTSSYYVPTTSKPFITSSAMLLFSTAAAAAAPLAAVEGGLTKSEPSFFPLLPTAPLIVPLVLSYYFFFVPPKKGNWKGKPPRKVGKTDKDGSRHTFLNCSCTLVSSFNSKAASRLQTSGVITGFIFFLIKKEKNKGTLHYWPSCSPATLLVVGSKDGPYYALSSAQYAYILGRSPIYVPQLSQKSIFHP